MRLLRARGVRLLVVLGACVAVPAPAAWAFAPSQLPTDLQALIAAEHRLNVTQYVKTVSVAQLSGRRSVLVSTDTSVGHNTPSEVSVTQSAHGERVAEVALGSTLYRDAPGLAGIDGGYAWVTEPAPSIAGDSFIVFAHAQVVFAPSSLVGVATKIQDLGHTTLSGQSVSQFLETEDSGTVRMYIAANGLMVRSVQTAGREVTTTTVSLTAPAAALVPSARQSVAVARLSAAVRTRVLRVLTQAFSV